MSGAGRGSPTSQSHIVADTHEPPRTLCGVKVKGRPAAAGVTSARWVQAVIDGFDPEWCAACLAAWQASVA